MKERLEYLDTIKGLAIFLMVMGHAIAWNYADPSLCIFDSTQPANVKAGGSIYQLIYSFHMPLFFIISGYLTYKAYSFKDFISFAKKKVIRLFLPWICTMWLVYIVRGAIGYWFLLCLFELSIIGFILICIMQTINKQNHLIIDLIILAITYLLLRYLHIQDLGYGELQLGKFMGSLLPFFTGVFLKKYKALFSICVQQTWFFTLNLIFFTILFVSRYAQNYNIILKYIYEYSNIILSISGSLLTFHILYKGAFQKLRPILVYIGQKTLPIYILHIIFVIQIPQIGEYLLTQNPVTIITLQILYSTIISITAILLSLFVYRIITTSTLLKYLFFGE